MDFGAFVQILPGKDGLVHISQISDERVERVSDKLKEGDVVRVKVLEVDRQGRVRLSMRNVDGCRAHQARPNGWPGLLRACRRGRTRPFQSTEHLFLQRAPALVVVLRHGGDRLDGVDTDDVLEAVAQLALLLRKKVQAFVEIAPDEVLQTAAVAADHLREEIAAHQRFAAAFLFGDDLQQDAARDVLLRLAIEHDEIDALDDQPTDVRERHVAAFGRVVEPAVRVLADDACAGAPAVLGRPGGARLAWEPPLRSSWAAVDRHCGSPG